MEHKGTKRIETERLTLRPFRVEDAEAMYHNWASDEMEILLDLETKKTVRLKKLIQRFWCADSVTLSTILLLLTVKL